MLRRIPVSLRFDDADSEFYTDFIEQKKNDRELSSLILDLLHVYHENPMVRDIVDSYAEQKNPYLKIQKQIERISAENDKAKVLSEILDDYITNAKTGKGEMRMNVQDEPKPERKEEVQNVALLGDADSNSHNSSTEVAALKEEVAEMRSMFKQFMEMNMQQQSGTQQKVSVEHTSPVVERPIIEVEKPVEKEIPITHEVPKEKEDTVIKIIGLSDVDETPKVEVSAEPKKKPRSFGKLVSSLENS